MPDVAPAADAGAGTGGPNASIPFGDAGAVQQLGQRLNNGRPGPPPGGGQSSQPPGGAAPPGGPGAPVQPPPQMGVPHGSPLDMRGGPVTPGQVQANFTPPPRQFTAWRDGLAALAHNGPALAALHQIAQRAAGGQRQ